MDLQSDLVCLFFFPLETMNVELKLSSPLDEFSDSNDTEEVSDS